MSKISLLAYAVLISVASLLIATVLYLAFLGWPVFMDNLTAKWLGVENVQDLKLVLEFNADVQPLPMRKP